MNEGGSGYRAKAYLFMSIDTSVFPSIVNGAEIGSEPLTSRTVCGLNGTQWIEVCHVRGNTQQTAEERLLLMVQGVLPCPFGDLRFLWPFLVPSEQGHRERYWLRSVIDEAVASLGSFKMTLNWARECVSVGTSTTTTGLPAKNLEVS